MLPTKCLIAALGLSVLAGCTSAPTSPKASSSVDDASWLRQSADCCQGLDTLPVIPLTIRGDLDLRFTSKTPVHTFDTGKSPFHALRLPRQAGPLKLSWTSEVQRDAQGHLSLFAPTLLVLDEQGNVQRRFDSQDFTYKPSRGLSSDRLFLSFGITPSDQADRVVILTSDTARAETTELLHPARAYARARHLVEPSVENPIAVHRASGKVALQVRPLGETDGLLAPLIGDSQQSMSVEAPVTPSASQSAPRMSGDALEGFDYRRMIRAALKADDIALAMELAERAERAGDHGVRAWLAAQLHTE